MSEFYKINLHADGSIVGVEGPNGYVIKSMDLSNIGTTILDFRNLVDELNVLNEKLEAGRQTNLRLAVELTKKSDIIDYLESKLF